MTSVDQDLIKKKTQKKTWFAIKDIFVIDIYELKAGIIDRSILPSYKYVSQF